MEEEELQAAITRGQQTNDESLPYLLQAADELHARMRALPAAPTLSPVHEAAAAAAAAAFGSVNTTATMTTLSTSPCAPVLVCFCSYVPF